jgi:hypothetical protein
MGFFYIEQSPSSKIHHTHQRKATPSGFNYHGVYEMENQQFIKVSDLPKFEPALTVGGFIANGGAKHIAGAV